MLKHNSSQLEMFQPSEYQTRQEQQGKRDNSHLEKLRGYYKVMYIFTAVIIVSLASFSIGVEKGKRIAFHSASRVIPAAHPAAAAITPVIPPVIPAATPKPIPRENIIRKKENIPTESFTIQVASVSQKGSITNELTRLKNKGYAGFSLAKGKYTIICVGKYGGKVEAQSSLNKIKNHYPDSMIRRL